MGCLTTTELLVMGVPAQGRASEETPILCSACVLGVPQSPETCPQSDPGAWEQEIGGSGGVRRLPWSPDAPGELSLNVGAESEERLRPAA